MAVTSATYANADATIINAVIDGVAWSVPNNPSNSMRQSITDWLAADPANKIGNFMDPITNDDVNQERDRRIQVGATFTIAPSVTVYVTGSDADARNLTNLALAAQLRLASGDNATLTTFRDGNNVDHDLTPSQMLSLWQQSANYVSVLYEKSWAIKAMTPIPADFATNSYWS